MLLRISAVGAMVLLAGCATVTKGTRDKVKFESTPSGATVTAEADLSGDEGLTTMTCKTPCEMKMKRKKTWKVSVAKEGYQTSEGELSPKFSADGGAGFVGNALVGGIIGAGIDAGTGALNDLKPNPYSVTLLPEEKEEEGEAGAENTGS